MGWESQGRQYHQWFGHGTSGLDKPATAAVDPGSAALSDSRADRAAFVAISAGHALPEPLRSQYAQVLQQNGLKNLKDSLPIWGQACGLPPDQFRKLLIGPKFNAQSAANLQALGRAFNEATSPADLTGASDLLAKVVEREGPTNLGYKLRWARDQTRYSLAQGQVTAAPSPSLRAIGAVSVPLMQGASGAVGPLVRGAVAVVAGVATAPEMAALAVAGAILLLATKSGVTNVSVTGYSENDRGVTPVSAEVNALDGTILLYHGRRIDPSTREGRHNVVLSVDAQGQVSNVDGEFVGHLTNGQLTLAPGITAEHLFQGPGSRLYASMPGPEGETPQVPTDPGYTEDTLEKMNQRGISPSDIKEALSKPIEVKTGESGNTSITGRNGVRVIVDPVTNEIVSVYRPGAKR